MNDELAAGPSGTLDWEVRHAGSGLPSLQILSLPDDANPIRIGRGLPGLYYVLPKVPQIARDPNGRPIFSLSLVLRRRPLPADDSIFELIESGSLRCDLTLRLPEELQSE